MAANHDTLVGKRLDSWKEIASFLGRAERTVKRWETERGLPVHRIPGGGRSAVFAYSNELADWLKGRTEDLDEDSSADVENHKADFVAAPTSSAAPAQVSVIAPPAVPQAVKNWPLPRIAAWIVPLLLAAALITYLSADHTGSPVKVIASPQPSSPEANNLSIGPDSVAVLPFTNVRGNSGTDYLSDGITESLIGSLARIPQLKVRSRDSVFRYKGKDVEARTAGADLGVSAVVSGRVTLQGDAVEVSAELTDVLDNTEIWGHRYTGKASNLIALQQQIAGDIAGELRSKLSRSERQQVISQGTEDPDAYNLYLKGRYAWNQRNFNNLNASIPYFNQAIAKDPQYALAYSALADVYAALPYFGDNPSEVFPKSSTAARKALQLDPTLAHPHAVLGSNEMAYDWDFAGGEAEFKKAIELDPNDATAHQWYAENLGMLGGREQDALHEIDLAHLLDPTSLIILRVKGSVLVAARRYDDSIAVCKQLLDENPTFNLARDCLAYAYWGKGMYSQAVEIWKAYGQNTGNKDDAEFGDALDRGFHAAGWPGALTEAIRVRLSEYKAGGFASPYQIARLYADLGEKEKAFQWLDIAYREHDFLLDQLNTAFQVDKIRSDPRFAALVQKVGLPQ